MYKYWNENTKPKYGDKAKLSFTDCDSFIVHVKSEDIHADLAGDVEKRYDTSNYEVERPITVGKNKKVIMLIKGELSGRIMK